MAYLVHSYRGAQDDERHHTEQNFESLPSANAPKVVLVLQKRGIAGRTVGYVLPRIIFEQLAAPRHLPHHSISWAPLSLRVGEVAKNRFLDCAPDALVSLFSRVVHRLIALWQRVAPNPIGFCQSVLSDRWSALIRWRTRENPFNPSAEPNAGWVWLFTHLPANLVPGVAVEREFEHLVHVVQTFVLEFLGEILEEQILR